MSKEGSIKVLDKFLLVTHTQVSVEQRVILPSFYSCQPELESLQKTQKNHNA